MTNNTQNQNKNRKRQATKICFAASSGGHLEQVRILKPLLKKYRGFYVTEKTEYITPIKGTRTYLLKQVNRKELMFPLYMIENAFKSAVIMFKEKPDVIITTGVLSVIPLCMIGKLFGIKLIYIESFAKIDDGTLSGRLLHKYADKFFVQWRSMLNVYPNAIYEGGVY